MAELIAEFEDPLSDPVILSYANCLRSGLLCAWRRVPSAATRLTSAISASATWTGLSTCEAATPSLLNPIASRLNLSSLPAPATATTPALAATAQTSAPQPAASDCSDPWDAELLAGPAVAKELWIFWYDDEPDNLRDVIAPELKGVLCV